MRNILGGQMFIHRSNFIRSLVPRPHHLTRRNGLVNQVISWGSGHVFATVSPIATFKSFYAKPAQKKCGHSSRDKIFLLVKECYIIITDLTISLVLTTFGEQAQEIRFCSPDRFSLGGTHRLSTTLR